MHQIFFILIIKYYSELSPGQHCSANIAFWSFWRASRCLLPPLPPPFASLLPSSFIFSIQDHSALDMFITMSAFLLNHTLATCPSPIIDNSAGDNPFQQMQAAGAHLIRTVDQHIFIEDDDLPKWIRVDEYRWALPRQHPSISRFTDFRTRPLDVSFIKQVMDILCRRTHIVGPVQASWLRIRADYAFGQKFFWLLFLIKLKFQFVKIIRRPYNSICKCFWRFNADFMRVTMNLCRD